MQIKPTKKPKNQAEALFWELAQENGWELTKRGWPDFFCWKDNKIMLIEVKAHRGRKLKKHQHLVMEALAKCGIDCYQWNPQTGFAKINCKPL